MSPRLISLSADLRRLQDEGYDVQIVGAHLVLRDVPYVNSRKEVKRGALVSQLSLAGDVTTRPATHVAYFIGEYPCDRNGRPIEQIRHSSGDQTLDANLTVQHSFSSKPPQGYNDYYEMMTTYIAMISSPAAAVRPGESAQTFPVVLSDEAEPVFVYRDTASSRAEIGDMNLKLALPRIAIVGLGGTGAYVLDLVAKTPVREIHIFDGDHFSQHNAFRCPGAPSIDDLRRRPTKVAYLKEQYSRLRRGIVAHETPIRVDTVGLLGGMSFVFICIDKAADKRLIVDTLVASQTPFVDVGMGIVRVSGALSGIVRATTGSSGHFEHITSGRRISFVDAAEGNEYSQNIQVADLNALNAALAVIKWKKLFGFYLDLDKEHHCMYSIDGNDLQNED